MLLDKSQHYVGIVKLKGRRIEISGLFGKRMPKSVFLSINQDEEMIEVSRMPIIGEECKLDKGCITIPNWIYEELRLHYDNLNEFTLIVHGYRRFISPKTGRII